MGQRTFDRRGMGHNKPLTPHQSGVAACLLDAMDNKEIARAMGHHPVSTEMHIRNLAERFEARNRVHLALILYKLSLENVQD